MRSDEEIERLLEDWLEDEARPIPREVLESSLESVARTTQASRRGTRARGWLRSSSLGMLVAAAVLIIALVGGLMIRDRIGSPPTASVTATPTQTISTGPSPSASITPAQAWSQPGRFLVEQGANPAADSYGNPGVWSYLETSTAHVPSSYEPLPMFANGTWTDPAYVNLQVYEGGGLVLHPFRTSNEGVRYIILAWKSPISGDVSISGSADMPQRTCSQPADGVTLWIDHESQTVVSKDVLAGGTVGFEAAVTVHIGESIYFVVDPRSQSSCDLTALTFSITASAQ